MEIGTRLCRDDHRLRQAVPLRSALARGEIALHYQPIVRAGDGQPAMVEALLRRPAPAERIAALAEAEGLAEALALAVVARAAAEVAPIRHLLPRLALTVNLPLGVLQRPQLPERLRRALHGTGLRPGSVAIELTETTPVRDRTELRRGLSRLREAGHPVLLDDVLSGDPRTALLDLPFTGFKLDRSLVEALPRQARARGEVRRLVAAAARRGQCVIAEGVGAAAELALLRATGVGLVQGFLIGRPMPAEALAGWSGAWRATRGAEPAPRPSRQP
jgi:EAL domain-containing protein (putative c-di-GMP-specific phosphodiesterase class I)